VGTYLERILEAHREDAACDPRSLDDLRERALGGPPTRSLRAALEGPGISVIAEVKRRSPSRGDIAVDLDPARLAEAYERGGAAAVSVLTDERFFGGAAADLCAARAAADLPVLRKDFAVDLRDICDARLMGADAVLLIVAALTDGELAAMSELAAELSLDALVEVHDEFELKRALTVGATLIGVNQRDLVSFAVDTDRANRVRAELPKGIVSVAESGISGRDDIAPLAAAGFDAVLVGEALVVADDPSAAVAALLAR